MFRITDFPHQKNIVYVISVLVMISDALEIRITHLYDSQKKITYHTSFLFFNAKVVRHCTSPDLIHIHREREKMFWFNLFSPWNSMNVAWHITMYKMVFFFFHQGWNFHCLLKCLHHRDNGRYAFNLTYFFFPFFHFTTYYGVMEACMPNMI